MSALKVDNAAAAAPAAKVGCFQSYVNKHNEGVLHLTNRFSCVKHFKIEEAGAAKDGCISTAFKIATFFLSGLILFPLDLICTLVGKARDICCKKATEANPEDAAKAKKLAEETAKADELAKQKLKADVKEEVKEEVKADVKEEVKADVKEEVKADVKEEVKADVKEEVKADVKEEVKADVKEEVKAEVKAEVKEEVKAEVKAEKPAEPKTEGVADQGRALFNAEQAYTNFRSELTRPALLAAHTDEGKKTDLKKARAFADLSNAQFEELIAIAVKKDGKA